MSDTTTATTPTNGDAEFRPPAAETRGGSGSGRMALRRACPTEKSKDFGASTRRLLRRMRPRAPACLPLVIVLAVVSVTLVVLGPKVLGPRHRHHRSTALRGGAGIDFAALHRMLLARRRAVRALRGRCRSSRRSSSPASCSGRCTGCAPTSRTSSTGFRSATSTARPRGDLLSRVTNDIDNISQSLQQIAQPAADVGADDHRRD